MEPRPKTAWLPLLALSAVPLILHLTTAGSYGIFRDEYYYLACARHLDWGYVDHPPLSMALLAVLRAIFGEGILALRLVPALCASALVVLVGRTASEMGGGRFAQLLAGLSIMIVGVVQIITGFFSMNALDLVVWTGAWCLLAAWAVDPTPRRMLQLGLLLGLGLLNKIGVLVFGAALALALPITPLRRQLLTWGPFAGGALALLLFLPHVIWQATHGWPTREFIANAQQYKITAMPPLAFIGEVVLEHQPANLLIWSVGLGWLLFAGRARPFRLLGLIFVIGIALLMLQRAKPYYAAGLFPVLFAAGACAWERFTTNGWRRWLRPALVVMLAGAGLFFLPMGAPVLTVDHYAYWQVWTGIAPAAQEVGHTSELPQYYSDRFGWTELAAEVGRVADSLPAAEREQAVIIARNYGHAGSLEYWSEKYDLPTVVSGHNNYAFWSPEEVDLDIAIVVGWNEDDVRETFDEVERAGTMEHPWALESGLAIWVARRPKMEWSELRENLRRFI